MASDAFKAWKQRFDLTGDICPVVLGWTREQVRALFEEPDDTGGTSSRHEQGRIWLYDSVEFHFDPDRGWTLFLIFEEDDGVVITSIGRKDGAG